MAKNKLGWILSQNLLFNFKESYFSFLFSNKRLENGKIQNSLVSLNDSHI